MISRKDQLRKASAKWRKKNLDKVKEYHKIRDPIYYRENKEKIILKNQEYSKNNYERRLFNSCKKRAKLNNLEFDLELSDIVIPEYCPYLKTKITNIVGEGHAATMYNASIDRIDNSKGYVKDNIEVISRLANRMKTNATKEELREFAWTIIERIKNDNA